MAQSMTPQDFCYWLQGYMELTTSNGPLDLHQVTIIQKHLALVITNVTDETIPTPRVGSTC